MRPPPAHPTEPFPWYGYLLVAAGHGLMIALAGTPTTRLAFVLSAFAIAALLWLLSRRYALSKRGVLFTALALRLLAFPIPPTLSDDSHRYVWDGEVQRAGHNPYAYRPSDPALADLHAVPVYDDLNSPGYYSVYPPLSQLVFCAGVTLADGNQQAAYYWMKGAFAAAEFGAVALLSAFVPAAALVLYAWHPLAVIEGAGQGHTEGLMLLFLALLLVAHRRGWGGWAGAAMAGATWVKLYPILLGPLLLWRWGWKPLVGGLAVTVPLLAWYYHPAALGHVQESLDLYVRLFEFNAGPYLALKGLLRLLTGEDWSKWLGPALRFAMLGTVALYYLYDWRRVRQGDRGDAFVQAMAFVLGALIAFATTVHPWYLLALLALCPLLHGKKWYWLATASIGTYTVYTDGPYWLWVWLGWGGWLVLAMWEDAPRWWRSLMQRRTAAKVRLMAPAMSDLKPGFSCLDLGSGEGFLGDLLARHYEADVTLVDVVDFNRSALPFHRYDGEHLPFEDNTFDVVVLSFVLHHAAQPDRVLAEAGRVARGRVVMLESTYRTEAERRVLSWLDRAVNRLRSSGQMTAQEVHLDFRTASDWRNTAEALGYTVVYAWESASPLDRKAVFGLLPPSAESNISPG